ncbi:GMC family oxidoreductase [Actinoplanes sp. NPDC049265]|uniref:GMC family oxidoreductase n=1 Tax=Actinoplanes sp. NPDC049265 TaxID=3363902 RepID=UPI00371329B2
MFDYVVVGGGAAGCALAAELSADPAATVLLLEAGRRAPGRMLRIPQAGAAVYGSPRYAVGYPTEPSGPEGRTHTWRRGAVLGGTTAVNGMMYNRGEAADWDAIPGWGWDDILPIFREIEDHELGASDLRGTGGPLPISIRATGDVVDESWIEAAGKHGVTRVEDVNAGAGERIGYTPATIRRGVRQTAYTALLHPVRHRPNLTVRTGAPVTRVLFSQDRASGVVVGTEAVAAHKEVILAAGGLETPKLLELSGIGDRGRLTRLGIDVILDRPAVGEQVMDHYILRMTLRLNRSGLGHNESLRGFGPAGLAASYLLRRGGFLARPNAEVLGLLRSAPGEPRPDFQVAMLPLSIDANERPEREPGMMLLLQTQRPSSRGSQHIVSADPAVPPRIVPNYLATADDRARLVASLGRVREILAEEPIAGLIRDEVRPGPAIVNDDQIVDHALRSGVTSMHAAGGCAMGAGPDAVLDPRLRVRGIEGLRVIDASALPAMISGNPVAPLLAMATLAARRIRTNT